MPAPDGASRAWVVDVLAREFGPVTAVDYLESRRRYDLYRAVLRQGPAIVKVGSAADLAVEAANLQRAANLVGDLAPALIGFVASPPEPGLLAMEYVPGGHLAPGRLSGRSWRHLLGGLLRLHHQGPGGPPVCFPLADDFVTLSVRRSCYASLPQLGPLLAAEVRKVPDLDTGAAPALFDDLAAEFDVQRPLFERPPRFVHADIWPENVLTNGSRCWLVDWIGLKCSDYAVDLANLKLILDWVWPVWRAHRAFESLLDMYASEFADATLRTRMRLLLPLVSLIHVIQFGQGGVEDPENAAAMRAGLAVAQRDRALWSLPDRRRRLLYAMTHDLPSEYGVEVGRTLRSTARRAVDRMVAYARL